jgi:pimeloyl-ACP methyl ester carboxylesterase
VTVPTIVLLHGQPDSSASFWPLRRELRARVPNQVRIVAPDRPGYGANPLPATNYAGNVRWLTRWLRKVNAGPTVLVGHSWAGGLAALMAAGETSPIAGLVLLASIGPSCLLRVDPVLAAPVVGDAIAYSMLRLGRPLIGYKARQAIFSRLTPSDRPYASASGLAMRHRPLWRSFLTEQRALVRELATINGSLDRIGVPTQVIAGTEDATIPHITFDKLVQAIPQSSRVNISGGTHDLQLRRPADVADSVSRFARPLLGHP